MCGIRLLERKKSNMNANQIPPGRILVFLSDFRQAQKFVWYILEKKLHAKKSDLSQLVHLAFNTSLIISYSRPFGGNKNFAGQGKSSLAQVLDKLNDDERKLHERVIGSRNTAYAHSDASAHLVPGWNYGGKGIKLMRIPFVPLGKSETEMLKVMIRKWIKYLESEKAKFAG
jgi:hypothetical protein